MNRWMSEKFIAHVRKENDGLWAEPHWLLAHLEGTAELAEKYASKFASAQWGYVAGLAHDLGKGRSVWQKYLRLKSGYDEEAHLEGKYKKIPHAIYGAKVVEKVFGKGAGRLLAYCIAGHHSGLPDWSGAEGAGQASLEFQLAQVEALDDIADFIMNRLQNFKLGNPPRKFSSGLDLPLWIRMLYSCVVDADFLDTERYMDNNRSFIRGGYCSNEELLTRFNAFIADFEKRSDDTPVNKIRKMIRTRCVEMADQPQGVFSLTVPTGGGKTLSSLAFGLNHACKHGLDRIIYVIPYTSIIEQNADVFRRAVGHDQVVEHHSSLDEDDSTVKSRLASENWDAPIIVTTSVQFFESLFSAKPSRCRKLHNIARSVVILDEAQLIPVEYLEPVLETLQLLVEHYGVTVVISTATQPAFGIDSIDGRRFGSLKNIKEITGNQTDIRNLYQALKRCQVYLPNDLHTPENWENIAEELKKYRQVLCIVSDRKSCRELYKLMPSGTFHLSALMCGRHRSEVIEIIKQKLKNDEPVRVISTQLVEAGVDMDFPVVYRALAGLDSIAQAAGRCNREGRMPQHGKVIVFNAPRKAPAGILRKAEETTRLMFSTLNCDPLDFLLYENYFTHLYCKVNSLDKNEIIRLLKPDFHECGIYFRTAAERFKVIDDSLQKTILVRYGEGEELIELLKTRGPDRMLLRKLQRYAVNVHKHNFNTLYMRGAIEEIQPGIYALKSKFDYSCDVGLLVDETMYIPEEFII